MPWGDLTACSPHKEQELPSRLSFHRSECALVWKAAIECRLLRHRAIVALDIFIVGFYGRVVCHSSLKTTPGAMVAVWARMLDNRHRFFFKQEFTCEQNRRLSLNRIQEATGHGEWEVAV